MRENGGEKQRNVNLTRTPCLWGIPTRGAFDRLSVGQSSIHKVCEQSIWKIYIRATIPDCDAIKSKLS